MYHNQPSLDLPLGQDPVLGVQADQLGMAIALDHGAKDHSTTVKAGRGLQDLGQAAPGPLGGMERTVQIRHGLDGPAEGGPRILRGRAGLDARRPLLQVLLL